MRLGHLWVMLWWCACVAKGFCPMCKTKILLSSLWGGLKENLPQTLARSWSQSQGEG